MQTLKRFLLPWMLLLLLVMLQGYSAQEGEAEELSAQNETNENSELPTDDESIALDSSDQEITLTNETESIEATDNNNATEALLENDENDENGLPNIEDPEEIKTANETDETKDPYETPEKPHTPDNETTLEEIPTRWYDLCKPTSYKDLECFDCDLGECHVEKCKGFKRPVCVTYQLNTNFRRSHCADDNGSLEDNGGKNATSCRKCYTKLCNDPRPRSGSLYPGGPYNTSC